MEGEFANQGNKMVGVAGFEPTTSSSRKSTDIAGQTAENTANRGSEDTRSGLQILQELAGKIRIFLLLAESACSAYAPQADGGGEDAARSALKGGTQ